MWKLLVCLTVLVISGSSARNNLELFKKEYGDGYGTKFVYFADDYGELHYVNLSIPMKNEKIPAQLTSGVESDKIEYRLYNGNDTYILLDKQGRAVNHTEQDVTTNIMRLHKPLKLITHGFTASADCKGVLQIKNAYLQAQKVTVITIDWSSTAGYIGYDWVAQETETVGGHVASFLDGLKNEYNVTGDQLHLIGHSLGAHVMGIAANATNSSVHRVTGLDPARPLFEYPAWFEKLRPTDAEIVDVIHTCAGLLGFEGPVGTVDFYPNEGFPPQPGCDGMPQILEACSHSISFHYFSESIKDPTIYPAYECKSWDDFLEHRCNITGHMGEGVNKDMTGTYYLKIDATAAPFHYVFIKKTTV